MKLLASLLISIAQLFATVASAPAAGADDLGVPRFLVPSSGAMSAEKPASIRFVTTDDFPPFNFLNPDGRLTGYNVELARAICVRLSIPCTIQVRAFPMLVDAVAQNEADAIIAGLKPTKGLASFVQHTDAYLRIPARFVTRSDEALTGTPESMAGRTVAVPADSRYVDYLVDFFPATAVRPTESMAEALELLRFGTVDAVFGSALSLGFWLAGPDGSCCRFAGGAYTEPAYFGQGLTIAVGADNDAMRRAIDDALVALEADGVLADLYLRFFPTSLY